MKKIETIEKYNQAVERVEILLKQLDETYPSFTSKIDELESELKHYSDFVTDYCDEHFSVGEPTTE